MRSKAARRGKNAKSPRPFAVAPYQFREARESCLLSVNAAAEVLHVTPRTIMNWEAGRVRPPYAAFKLMRVLRGYKLPHSSWDGWQVSGDALYSPEGLAYRARDHSWWSLIVRKANAYSEARRELLEIKMAMKLSNVLPAESKEALATTPEGAIADTRSQGFIPPANSAVASVASAGLVSLFNKGEVIFPFSLIMGFLAVDVSVNIVSLWCHFIEASYDRPKSGSFYPSHTLRSARWVAGVCQESGLLLESFGSSPFAQGAQLVGQGLARSSYSQRKGAFFFKTSAKFSYSGSSSECSLSLWKWYQGQEVPSRASEIGSALPSVPSSDMFASRLAASAVGCPDGLYKAMADTPARITNNFGFGDAYRPGGAL